MPYGYSDEQWNKMDTLTKYRIQSQAQTSMKQASKAARTTTPATTTTTKPKTTQTTAAPTTNKSVTPAKSTSVTSQPTTSTTTKSNTSLLDSVKGVVGGMDALGLPGMGAVNDALNKVIPTSSNLGWIQNEYSYNPANDTNADILEEIRRQQEETLAEMRRQQEALAEAQREAQIAQLQKARDAALSSLEAERASIDPYYYDKRNQAAAQSDISAKNFAEYMAAQGIRGSAAGLPEIYRNAALQGQIGRLNQQQAAEHADIARRRTGIESAYQSDVAAANAGIDAQTMQAYIDSMKTLQQQRAADLAAMGLTSTGQLTLAGREAQNAELERRAALLAAQHYDDIQAYINTLDPNDPIVPYLYAARRTKMTDEAERAAAAAAAQSEAQQTAWKNAFELFKSVGRITSAEQAQILGLPMDATVADVDIARMNAQTSRMNAETAQTNANKTNEPSASDTYNNAVKNIDSSMYVYKDADGKIVVSNPQGLRNYIISLNLPDELTDSLLLRYGLPINQ